MRARNQVILDLNDKCHGACIIASNIFEIYCMLYQKFVCIILVFRVAFYGPLRFFLLGTDDSFMLSLYTCFRKLLTLQPIYIYIYAFTLLRVWVNIHFIIKSTKPAHLTQKFTKNLSWLPAEVGTKNKYFDTVRWERKPNWLSRLLADLSFWSMSPVTTNHRLCGAGVSFEGKYWPKHWIYYPH